MQKQLKLKYAVATIFATIFFVFFSNVQSGARLARAATVTSTNYEQSNVLNDLEGSTVDGKPFDIKSYGFDKQKRTQILSFIEFCYSFDSNRQHDYGLYVYVYNPQGLDYDTGSAANKISLRYTGMDSTSFDKYSLKFLNQSTAAGYEGLFYKYRITLSEAQRKDILNTVNSSSRVYEVSEIELLIKGDRNATAYDVSKKYTYTGYAKGYGSAAATESTLNCMSAGTTTLTLDVHPATYRPEGTNGKNNYTQDSLDSVYFSIPNKIITEYGGLSAIHATWLNALTEPIFVTGNEDIYNALYSLVWEYYGDVEDYLKYFGEDLNYCFVTNAFEGPQHNEWNGDLYFNCEMPCFAGPQVYPERVIDRLYYLFYADGVSSVADYVLKGAELLDYMQSYSSNLCDNPDPVAGKYWSYLFANVNDKYEDINIKADDKYSLTSEKITQEWWEKLFGLPGSKVEINTTFKEIEAIHAVTKSDFKNTVDETCKALYIGKSYYDDFKTFYDRATSRNETVYLFRYYQSEYISREVTEFEYKTSWGNPKGNVHKIDTNAYLAQEVVHIDFDIIDVTCTKGDVSTALGVVSSPKDIAPDITPPPTVTQTPSDWWKYALGIAAALIVTYVIIRVITTEKAGSK